MLTDPRFHFWPFENLDDPIGDAEDRGTLGPQHHQALGACDAMCAELERQRKEKATTKARRAAVESAIAIRKASRQGA